MTMKKLLLTVAVSIALTASTIAQVPSYVPTNGLVGWWPFNGNANDESGNNNNGTVNGATLTNDRLGNANKAYAFDGVNDKIVSPIINPLQANWSVSFWYRSLNSTSNFQGQNVIGLGSDMYGWGGAGFQISGQNPPGQCPTFNYLNQMYMFDASQECGGNYLGGDLYSNTTWYNVVIIKNNLNYDLIINNVMITSSVLLDIDIDQLIFGNRDISFQYFNGNVDDIGIWDRILTECEISDLYNSQLGSLNTSATQTQTALDLYTWPINSQTYTQSGTYTAVIPNAAGCDSTITLDLSLDFTGLEENSEGALFSVFPNPAQSTINVKLDIKLIGKVYSIYDNTGRVVLTGKVNSENTTIELGNLLGGIYMFSVGENMKQSFKVIKE